MENELFPNEILKGVCVIPPSKENYYCAKGDNLILEAGPDLGFILKTQILVNQEDFPKERKAVKNLRILIIMTRKDKWKPSTVALFHGD